MKSLLGSLAFVLPVLVSAAYYPDQPVLDDATVHFGQSLSAVEHMVGIEAKPDSAPLSRTDVDRRIVLPTAELEFDAGKLAGIVFKAATELPAGIAVFPAAWRNLDAIGEQRLRAGMTREEFLAYLAAWEARAAEQNIRKRPQGEPLQEGEYSINLRDDDVINCACLSFGPSRLTGKNGMWMDTAVLTFVSRAAASTAGAPAGTLALISVVCDEFNTRGRDPSFHSHPTLPGSEEEESAIASTPRLPPTREAILHLLDLSQAAAPTLGVFHQIDGGIRAVLGPLLEGEDVPEAALAAAERCRQKIMAAFQAELGWERTRETYIELYTRAFTREEIDDLIAFYESPTGQLLVTKVPQVLQIGNFQIQARLRSFLEAMQGELLQAREEIDELRRGSSEPVKARYRTA